MTNKIKNLIHILAVCLLLSGLSGVFAWEFPEGFWVLLGGVMFAAIIWLEKLAWKSNP